MAQNRLKKTLKKREELKPQQICNMNDKFHKGTVVWKDFRTLPVSRGQSALSVVHVKI